MSIEINNKNLSKMYIGTPPTDATKILMSSTDSKTVAEKINENVHKIGILNDKLDNGVIQTPIVSIGMNNVIRKTDNIESIPKFTMQGKSYVNLLGKDGSLAKDSNTDGLADGFTTGYVTALSLSNGIQSYTATAQFGGIVHSNSFIDAHIYYACASIKTSSSLVGLALFADIGKTSATWHTGDNTFRRASTRNLYTASTCSSYPNLNCCDYRVSGWDSIQIKEIMLIDLTATFGTGNEPTTTWCDENLPYVDSYACLQNPYIEVRHDNLVRNGNGEEGIGWWTPVSTNQTFTATASGFRLTSTSGAQWLNQTISVKSNTNYYISSNITNGTTTGLVAIRDSLNTTTLIATNGMFNSGNNRSVIVQIVASSVGYADFSQLELIEGTTAPTEYKPCRIERCVIEGKFTSDDSFTYENSEVSGLLNWKHKNLYGKDYDWQFEFDQVGFKVIGIPNGCRDAISNSDIGIKYDGKILKNATLEGDWLKGDLCQAWNGGNAQDGTIFISVLDSDTGWAETIQPNADEVKAFMNGWTALATINSRYVMFRSIVDGKPPQVAIYSTVTTSANSGQKVVTVADASKFAVGDLVYAFNEVYGTSLGDTIAAISGSNITLSNNIPLTTPVGYFLVKADNGTTNTSLLTYCKNNIAPNYKGYQLHYKLANPEPITDANTHIVGDIPKFDNGDNYLDLNYGYVIGEIANPVVNGTTSVNINCGYQIPNSPSFLQNKIEDFISVYKNQIYDTNWRIDYTNPNAYGRGVLYTLSDKFDTNATYTVDYKILSTLHTSPTSIAVAYQQDVLSAVSDLAEITEHKQNHDSALDNIVDLSVHEKVTFGAVASNHIVPVRIAGCVYLSIELPFKVEKKVLPSITVSNLSLYRGYDNVSVLKTFSLYQIGVGKDKCILKFSSVDPIDVTQWYYGYYGSVMITADCIGRV